VHTDNGLPPSVLSGRVSHSSFGDRTVPWLRKSSAVWIWQHDKRTDYYMILLNCVRKLMKNNAEKEAGKDPSFKKADGARPELPFKNHLWITNNQQNTVINFGQDFVANIDNDFFHGQAGKGPIPLA
jgi:hypothetical protein